MVQPRFIYRDTNMVVPWLYWYHGSLTMIGVIVKLLYWWSRKVATKKEKHRKHRYIVKLLIRHMSDCVTSIMESTVDWAYKAKTYRACIGTWRRGWCPMESTVDWAYKAKTYRACIGTWRRGWCPMVACTVLTKPRTEDLTLATRQVLRYIVRLNHCLYRK